MSVGGAAGATDTAATTGVTALAGPQNTCALNSISGAVGSSASATAGWGQGPQEQFGGAVGLSQTFSRGAASNAGDPSVQDWLQEQSADAAVSQLRQLARQFAQEAMEGVSGVAWVDLQSGVHTPCRYRLDRSLSEISFFLEPAAASKAPPCSGRSTTASSSDARDHRRAVISGVPMAPLLRIPLRRIRDVRRPQHSGLHMAATGTWLNKVSEQNRECLA